MTAADASPSPPIAAARALWNLGLRVLILHQSNRLEVLASNLADLTREPLASPFTPEIVVVQSLGMGRWLSMWLATELGLCANVRFPYPASYLWTLFRAVLDDVPESPTFDPGVTTWHLMDLLAQLDDAPAFEPLHAYLAQDDDLRRWELARRIADTFDQYLVYRPDWIREWTAGTQDDWQAQLWRRLAQRVGQRHRVDLFDAFTARLRNPAQLPAAVPARISLFGIPSLPPAYVDVIAQLAQRIEVHGFIANPCRTFWEHVRSERQIARMAGPSDPDALHLEVGNRLLAGLGRQGREFLSLLAEHDPESDDAFTDVVPDTLLHALQSDILELHDRTVATDGERAADGSLQVHVCHGALREVEVLHDQLLLLFDQHPTLTPSQVVVMTPDIEAYAPAIDAVFGTAPPARRIPFTIADRRVHRESPLSEALFGLLALPASRYEAGRVLALLEAAAVRRRFDFEDADLLRIRQWVQDAGVRWGVDATARAALGVPPTAEHTWRFGLDRLLLGMALADDVDRHVGPVVPLDDVDGSEAVLVGRLATFLAALGELRTSLPVPRPPAEWAGVLRDLFDRFLLADDADEADAQALRDAIARLDDTARDAGAVAPVSLDLVTAHLRETLDVPGGGSRFLAGSVTFCALVPMRSIPFDVVCLIGMNDGVVPRTHRPVSFDHMADRRRRGDRSHRDDDRYLFLEAICSARRCLYLSYVGRDLHDNTERPPSVLISELLEVVQRGFGADVVVEHALQPFSRSYFDGSVPRRISYSEELCAASAALAGGDVPEPPFVRAPLPAPGEEWLSLPLERFVQFFMHPAKFLLRERVGIRLDARETSLLPREPFILDKLEAWHVRQAMLALQQRGVEPALASELLHGRGLLPHGAAGDVVMDGEWGRVADFAERLASLQRGVEPVVLPVALELGGVRLDGVLDGLLPDGRLEFRLGALRASDRIAFWVRHLVLQLVAPAGVNRSSRWLGDGDDLHLPPIPDAEQHLAQLVACYRAGVCAPLRFFPEVSWGYCTAKEPTLARARQKWVGSEFAPGAGADPYLDLAFRGRDPITDEFAAVANAIFGPLLAAQASA